MERAVVAQDGSSIEIVLTGEDGAKVTLAFTAEGLEDLAGRATHMVAMAQQQKQAGSTEMGVRATDVAAASALAPIDGGKVILGIRSPSGLIYNFAFNPDLIAALMPQFRKAEYAARHPKPRETH